MKFAANQAPYTIPLISHEDVIKMSDEVLARPDIPIRIYEDVFRIRVANMDWDIGLKVYEPEDSTRIPTDKNGKKIGFFLLHGGDSDFRLYDPNGRTLAGKFGYKVIIMTYPGRLNLQDESRVWHGDTIYPSSIDLEHIESVRMPIWQKDHPITRDQYDIRLDNSKYKIYGTMVFAHAKPDTELYYRLAAWPLAFDEAMQEACRRHYPVDSWKIFVHGHSTGGPFSFIMSQRVPNVMGIAGCENSPFGRIFSRMVNISWNDMPFDEVRIQDWRNVARMYGDIVLKREGPEALERLASIMEEVFETFRKKMDRPNFRVESLIHHDGVVPLEQAARALAKWLGMNEQDTEELVQKYVGYTHELSGPGVKPVPPFLNILTKVSRNHDPAKYTDVALPMFAQMDPAPKVCVIQVDAGRHMYVIPEEEALPKGLCPVVAKLWDEAIHEGFFDDYEKSLHKQ